MREILFKAKRADNGEWIEGYFIKRVHNEGQVTNQAKIEWQVVEEYYIYEEVKEAPYEIIPETLGQFTGLYDKNGKRIWENDIIFDTYYKKLGVVKFGMGTFDSGIYRYYGWHYESEGSVDHHELYKYDELVDFEVLGNRFDNPELLTAERKE